MRARPYLQLELPLPPEEVLSRFERALCVEGAPCAGHVGSRELSLVVREAERHLFSPTISLEIRPAERGASVRGTFGPHPTLWTAFVLIYSALLFGVLISGSLGLVQWSLGMPAWGLWLAAGLAGVELLACAVDLGGRRIGATQMARMRRFVCGTLDVSVEASHPAEVRRIGA